MYQIDRAAHSSIILYTFCYVNYTLRAYSIPINLEEQDDMYNYSPIVLIEIPNIGFKIVRIIE